MTCIPSRLSILTRPLNGRPACHHCGQCNRGCTANANFSSPAGAPAQAKDPVLRPNVLASEAPGSVADAAAKTRQSLAGAGFRLAGEYPLSDDALVIAATSDALLAAAARTPDGAYGAAVRVSVTKSGDAVQVAYTNPAWMASVYRLAAEPEGVAAALERALGKVGEFGSKDGLPAKSLRAYHYMMFMP